jgi:cathepsin A (carboxypeptidase C)
MLNKLILLSAACLLSPITARKDDLFLNEDFESGLVNITKGDDIFYWLFRSKSVPSTDPLVMWLTGGPGCASEVALFYENGPFNI